MADKILLTISLLISKRPDTVRKCLDSIQPLLDAIPSELILTDTGCGEEVRAIIEEYTDHIIDFEWCRDFSKARNVGLHAARGEWFMFLDDDEWFEDVTEIIEFFRTGEYKKYGMAAYNQRNYHNRQGDLYADLAVGRMIRLDPDIEFMYSIHEVFNRVPGNVKKFKAYVHHYGYVYDTEEERNAHSYRNISLLLEEHRRNPGNQKHTLQLLKEYSAVGKWQESLDMSLEGIEWIGRGEDILRFCEPSYYVNIVDAYIQMDKGAEMVIETGEKFLAEARLDPLAKACIYAQMAAAWLERAEKDTENGGVPDVSALEKVLDYARKYWDACYLEKKQDDIYLQNITSVTADCFAPQNVNIVLGNGVIAAIGLEQFKTAEELFGHLERGGAQLFISNRAIKAIADAMLDREDGTAKADPAERDRILTDMCNSLLEREELQERVRAFVEQNISACEDEEAKLRKIQTAAGLRSDYWYFHILRVTGGIGSGEEQRESNRRVWANIAESLPFITQYRLWEYLTEEVSELLAQVPLQTWRAAAASYCVAEVWDKVTEFDEMMTERMGAENWYLLAWQEAYLFSKLHRGQAADAPAETLYAYGDCVRQQAGILYREEIIRERQELLPTAVQAAYRVEELRDLAETGEFAAAVKMTREIVKLLPELAGAVKAYMAWMNERIETAERESQSAQSELLALAQSVKQKAKELIRAGEKEAAKQVLMQLKTMVPDDRETALMLAGLENE